MLDYELNLVMLIFNTLHSYPFMLVQLSSCNHAFSIRMENNVDPDQMASSEAS